MRADEDFSEVKKIYDAVRDGIHQDISSESFAQFTRELEQVELLGEMVGTSKHKDTARIIDLFRRTYIQAFRTALDAERNDAR